MSYWTKRQKQLKESAEKEEARIKKRLSSFYDEELKRLEREIAAYYQEYGEDNVIAYRNLLQSLSNEDRALLMKRMDEFAEKYPQYADLMPVRESIYKLDRLQGLQYSVSMSEANIAGYTAEQIQAYETSLAHKGLNYAMETLGFGKNFYAINSDIVKSFVNVPWCNGENFSTRIWNDTQKLAQYLNQDLAQGFARGDSYDRLVRQIRQRFSRVNRRDAYRLVYTEGTYVMAESSMRPFTEDFSQYRISTVEDGRVCQICRAMSEKVFEIPERQPGTNFPPFHPWCVIPDTKIIAPDIEAITKSWYSGDVIKITTANGGRLTVSPNHIVLTSRGWVRAKHLIKGDKVVHYCAWRKSLSESDPAHDNSVPTVEELFASFVESGTVSPVSVPATSEDFKGDVVVNSKIDIINIDSELRNKLNASFDKFIGDIPFVGASISSKVKLSAHSCLELLLAGAGLAADGIMSGLNVSKVLLSGSFTHHELIGFRNPSDYDARIFKSTRDSGTGNAKDIGEFIDAFPGIVEFDDLINVERDSFIGHVYDASSLSTLYIANGIITSNCRCTFEIVVDDWDQWMDDYVAKHSGDRRQAEKVAKRLDGEREFSPRKATGGDYGVDWPKIQAAEYREGLEKLSNNKKVVDAIETRARWALNNRDGLKTEELYAISLDSGEEVASILGQQLEARVERTKLFTKKLNDADLSGEQILLIHNHPRGYPPSIGDINALYQSKNVSGITVGHDGSIYYYTRPQKPISEFDFAVALRRYKEYTQVTGQEKALEDLSHEYGFVFRKLSR